MANEINLFGEIGRGAGKISAQQVKTMLASADQTQPLIVRIDSEGGSVFDGLSIYEAFAQYPGPKKAVIESTAFSIASYIAMAFDEVEIAENGYLMIHEPASEVMGTREELTKSADLLAKLDQSMVEAYCRKTGLSEPEIRSLMQEETFFNAKEALSFGLANRIQDRVVMTRITPDAKHEKKLPQRVFAALFGAGSSGNNREPEQEKTPMSATQTPVAATIAEIKAAYPKMKAEKILSCIERQLPLASVAAAAAEELMKENEDLQAKLTAMEEEMAKLKAEGGEEEPPAEEPSEEEAQAKATARKVIKPVARVKQKSNVASALQRWDEVVAENMKKAGGNRARAFALANRLHPGLREQMIEEANAGR